MLSTEIYGLTCFFRNYITEHKQRLFEKVLNERTRHITVVLEDIYQSQNASAVIRTCDCLGIQDVHIIENIYKYTLNKNVVLGAHKWIDIFKYDSQKNNTAAALTALKEKGYKIVIMDPDHSATPISTLCLKDPVALVFGTEKTGLTKEAYEMADEATTIPMIGFSESFNISVSAAIALYTLRNRLEQGNFEFKISDEEKDLLRLQWYKRMVKHADLLEKQYLLNKIK